MSCCVDCSAGRVRFLRHGAEESSSDRSRDVTGRRMAAVIAAELKNFRYCYENRNSEKESAETILAALRDLTPGGEEKP